MLIKYYVDRFMSSAVRCVSLALADARFSLARRYLQRA